ncbi:MAG: vWA domain-containing protein [Planctomycetota bacterium]|jgi:Mg-chelatase subunit ChlD
MDREERERLQRRKSFLRSPGYLAVAVAVHLALIAWLWTFGARDLDQEPDRTLRATLTEDVPIDEVVEELPEPPELQPPEPEPIEQPMIDETVEEVDTEYDPRPGSSTDLLGVGGSDRGGRRSALAGGGVGELDIGSGSTPFRAFVDDLRARGLDVVFVVDATASMDRFIQRARATIDDIIADLSAVVPDLRLGIVAYRDRQDDWLTRQVDLTDDRYRIHNFLADLEAAGGGDFEEAVDEGLRVATEQLSWRDGTRRVVILVGDAPPHEDDEGATMQLVRSFSRDAHSAVSALFTTEDAEGRLTERETRGRAAMEKIARTGGGILSSLAESVNLRDRILDASFGSEWMEEIRALVSRQRDDRRQRIVASKVKAEDVKWLLRYLDDEPIHPSIVNGCIELFDRSVADRVLELLTDETRPTAVRSVALYILKRTVAPGVAFDVEEPLADQQSAIAKFRREVDRNVPAAAKPPGKKPPGLPPRPPGN